jgi:N-acetylneuraminate synthase
MISDIWKKKRPYVIAEIAQNHDGSLGQAHAFIDAVASTGADAIKFQTHIAEEESTVYEPFRVKFSYEDNTRYEYWKRMEFTEDQWRGLFDHATEMGLDFLSSPFSEKALGLLDRIGIPAWKFGAGEVFNEFLLEKAINTGKPILLSTGLSTLDEIEQQIKKVQKNGNDYLIFQCVTAYPSTAETIDINQVKILKEKFNCAVGISDHSATIYPALAATTLGASAIEVHVTMSPFMFGPDVKASVNLEQLKEIVEGSAFISKMLENNIDMGVRSSERDNLKNMFSKSLYATRDIAVGEVITYEMFKAKKPNIGIDSREFPQLLGKIIVKGIKKGEPLTMEDVKDEKSMCSHNCKA